MALLWRHNRQDEGGVTSPALVVFPGGNYRNIKDKHVNHSHGAGTLPFNDTRRWRSHLVYEEGGDVAGLLQLACADDHPAQLRSRLRRHDRPSQPFASRKPASSSGIEWRSSYERLSSVKEAPAHFYGGPQYDEPGFPHVEGMPGQQYRFLAVPWCGPAPSDAPRTPVPAGTSYRSACCAASG